jgi:hypothetical protein
MTLVVKESRGLASNDDDPRHDMRRADGANVYRVMRRCLLALVALGLVACSVEASPSPPVDSNEYTRSSSAGDDAGAFVIVDLYCEHGDTLIEGTCSDGAKFRYGILETSEEGAGWQCGDYNTVTTTVRCAR